jgi:integrase/recombinase XerD
MKADAAIAPQSNDDLIAHWERDATVRGMSSETIKNYVFDLRHFAALLNKKELSLIDVDRMIIRDFIDVQRERGLTTQTIRHRLTVLSNFYEFLIFEEIVNQNPVNAVRKRYLSCYKIDSEIQTHKIISIEEAASLINSILDIRDKAIIVLLLKTGIRRGELISLELSDINWSDNSILLKPTKKRTNRLVYFDEETARILRRWLRVRADRNKKNSQALFISSWGKKIDRGAVKHLINKAAIRVGLHDVNSDRMEDHFSAHCCRHWFTTHLRRAGMPREFIQELRGDVRKEAIDIYDHIDKKELRESYLAHIPQLGI